MTGITVTRRDDRLVAVKRASGEGCGRRQREARLLARLDHPGVVQFVDVVDGDPTELHMSYVGSDTWRRRPPVTHAEVVEGLAAVASTVADLHDLGISHRSLGPDHVLVTAEGRPVLCGLADADTADAVGRASDLAGLAGLITFVAHAGPEHLRTPLERLADRAASSALSARELTEALDALPPAGATRTSRAPGRAGRLVLVGLAVLALGVAASWFAGRSREPEVRVASAVSSSMTPEATTRRGLGVAATDARDSTTTVVAPPTTTTLSSTTTTGPPATARMDRPVTTVASDEALVMIHEGRRYGLGVPGDTAVLGDWDCDGRPTPALLRSGLDLVAIFAEWPQPGDSVEPTSTRVVPDATDLRRESVHGCDRLRVFFPSGSILITGARP